MSGKRRDENGLFGRIRVSRGCVSSASFSYSGYTGLVHDFLQENSGAVLYNLSPLLFLAQLSKFISKTILPTDTVNEVRYINDGDKHCQALL